MCSRPSAAPGSLFVVAEVFVYRVQDVDAASWKAEMALIAESRQEAFSRLRAGGLHKKQFDNDARPVEVVTPTSFEGQFPDDQAILRRRDNDSGWTAWEVVPSGQSLDWRISGTAQRDGTHGLSGDHR
jgi:hypothetical protein